MVRDAGGVSPIRCPSPPSHHFLRHPQYAFYSSASWGRRDAALPVRLVVTTRVWSAARTHAHPVASRHAHARGRTPPHPFRSSQGKARGRGGTSCDDTYNLLGCCGFIGAFLTLLLVPLSFTKIQFYEHGLLAQKSTSQARDGGGGGGGRRGSARSVPLRPFSLSLSSPNASSLVLWRHRPEICAEPSHARGKKTHLTSSWERPGSLRPRRATCRSRKARAPKSTLRAIIRSVGSPGDAASSAASSSRSLHAGALFSRADVRGERDARFPARSTPSYPRE